MLLFIDYRNSSKTDLVSIRAHVRVQYGQPCTLLHANIQMTNRVTHYYNGNWTQIVKVLHLSLTSITYTVFQQ